MKLHLARSVSMFVVLSGILAAGLAGCGEALPTFSNLTPVTGTVKLNGAPLADAEVQFIPDFTPLPQDFLGSMGKTDANGKYQITTGKFKGTIPGKFKVTVSKFLDKNGQPLKFDPATGMDLAQLRASGDAVESVPAEYSDPGNAKERAEVVAGKPLVKDIDITSQK